MPNQSTLLFSVEKTAVRLAEALGYEFIDLELVKEPAGRFLRFFIDKTDGITLDEIEIFHRKIQPECENVDYDYMEVSSPGVDRPLKKPRDFERALGKRVEVRLYKPQCGAKAHTGELLGLVDGRVVIRAGDAEMAFALKDVALVKPEVIIDADMLGDFAAEDE